MTEFVPIQTEKLTGHHPNDIIVIYSKYEDLENKNLNPEFIGKYVPQWLVTDYVNSRRGISLPMSQPILCTYKQMYSMGRENMGKYCKGKINRILFYYSKTIISINDMTPF